MGTDQNKRKRGEYASDISRNGWASLEKELPKAKSGQGQVGRPACEMREIINSIFHVVKTGCSWRSLPHDLPHWATVYGYFHRYSQDGTWEMIHTRFVKEARQKVHGRKARPTAGCVDSQSVPTTACGATGRGYDAYKRSRVANASCSLIHRGFCCACMCVRPTFASRPGRNGCCVTPAPI